MALAMSRPHKHSKTGVYWVRKRVPADLVPVVDKAEVTRSLGTKDAAEAKRRHRDAVAEIEEQWANLRGGEQTLTEREAHALAVTIYENWLALHRDNPSEQYLWHTELFGELWTVAPLPEREPEPGQPGEMPIENILLPAMRQFCFQQADFGLAEHGLRVDAESRFRLAKAIGAALQRASIVLEREAKGIFAPGEAPAEGSVRVTPEARSVDSESANRPAKRADDPSGGRGVTDGTTITSLLEGWWQEAKAAGRKRSTYESYRDTVEGFVTFLGHDEAKRLTAADVIAYKDHRLTTPSAKTGRVPSAKTVKDGDLSALKTVFGWAVANRKMATNPASGITIKLAKPPKLRSKKLYAIKSLAAPGFVRRAVVR